MARRAVVAVVLGAVALVAACSSSGDDDEQDAAAGDAGDVTTDTEAPVDDSPFCVAIRALEALGSAPDDGTGTAEEVLAQNDEVSALLDDATASAPEDAPADVQALFDDYRVLSDAITAAAGDTTAAFEALSTDEPELMARLGQPDAHDDAFTFFAERCGTAPPTSEP